VHLGIILVSNQLAVQFFFSLYVYFNSLHVLSNPVLIIRRVNCINKMSGLFHSEILDHSLVFRVTYTRYCFDTVDSPDDEHGVARNVWRIDINI